MILVLDSTLSENRDLMEALVEELEEAGVEYRVGEGGPVGSIRWRRKQKERNVTDDARVCVSCDMYLPMKFYVFSGTLDNRV